MFQNFFSKAAFLSTILAVSGVAVTQLPAQLELQEFLLDNPMDTNAEGFYTSITNAGDDRLFLTRKFGRIDVYQNGSILPTAFLDIDTLVDGSSNFNEKGLLSMAFHPDFATNGFFYVNYTGNRINSDFDTIIARYSVSVADPNVADTTERRLLEIPQDFTNHNGGNIQFGPDGMLYVGMGDGGSSNDPNCRAQERDTLLGKMLRLDVDQNVMVPPYFGIPADNPFIGEGDPMDKAWALGLRNPWRFTFDRSTGDLWIADVGQNAEEEVNFQLASSPGGENYGWKVMEGDRCTNLTNGCAFTPLACNSPLLTDPVTTYDHNVDSSMGLDRGSITGGYLYRGTSAPTLLGKYLYGEYLTGEIFSWDPNTDTTEVLFDTGQFAQGPVTFGEDINGDVYVAFQSAIYLINDTTASSSNWLTY